MRLRSRSRPFGKTVALQALVSELCADGPWSTLEARVELVGRGSWTASAGEAAESPAAPLRHDLASLTKPFVATLALALARTGELALDARVGELFARADQRMARVRLEALLRHRSGLLPWTPFELRADNRDGALDLLLSGRLLGASVPSYSDLGPVLWGFCAERATGRSLGDLLRERVLAPLQLTRVEWCPRRRGDIARCCLDNSRERELATAQGFRLPARGAPRRGSVQDGNARFLSRGRRLAGHAGLFGDAASVAALAREWLQPRRVLTEQLVADAFAGGGEHSLGWARRRARGSAGPALSREAFGHTGFTGGSIWADPRTGLLAVLLGHRRTFADLNPWRRRFHAFACELAGAGDSASRFGR